MTTPAPDSATYIRQLLADDRISTGWAAMVEQEVCEWEKETTQLKAENAEFRTALERIRSDAQASDSEREVQYAQARALEGNGLPFWKVCNRCDSVEIAAATLARADQVRGGE